MEVRLWLRTQERECTGSEHTPQSGRLIQVGQPIDNMSGRPGDCSHTSFQIMERPCQRVGAGV